MGLNVQDKLDAATAVIAALRVQGYEAYLVGGCVRDMLLEREPKDFDVTTNALPDTVMGLFDKTISVGASFGVVVVMVGDIQVEVATFRADGEYGDGRRPDSVRYSESAKEDVVRRDFTINGLLSNGSIDRNKQFYDSITQGYSIYTKGETTFGIIDHVNGRADLANGVIRCIGDPEARFGEDALRMLRAVRFAAQLGFEIEPKTFDAIAKLAPTINRISKERTCAELFKLVTAPFPVKGLVPLVTTGLARHVIPEVVNDGNFATTLRRFTMFQTEDPLKGMAMLLADVYTPESADPGSIANYFLRSLKLSNDQFDVVAGALDEGRNRLHLLDCMRPAEMKKLARRPGFLLALELFEQDCAICGDAPTEEYAEAIAKVRAFTPEDIRPTPLATGDDLIAWGMKPGPVFTKLLGALEEAQLNGEVTTRAEALDFLTRQTWEVK